MNSEIAVNLIGQILMAGRDNTPLGVDKEKDFKAFHKSLQYFHLEWMREEIRAICQKHDRVIKYNINEYLLAIRKLSRHDKKMYELWWPASRRAYRELVIHTIPEIHIKVDGTRRKPHIQISNDYHIIVYDSSNGNLYPSEIIKFFLDIDNRLRHLTEEIIKNRLKSLVPDTLKSYFISGKITKDMGHSIQDDGMFSIGHEIRLRISDAHDMVYAYTPDYFWQNGVMKRTFENVEYGYRALTDISRKLPKDVEFICQHRDDCGISLTDKQHNISRDEFIRRRAVLMAYSDQEYKSAMNDKDYMDIMEYFGLCDRFPLHDFINMCKRDIDMLLGHKQVISSQLGTQAEEISVVFNASSISIFLMKNRERRWERECFLKFPYGSNLSFLRDICFYQDRAKELIDVFDKSWDIETTIGLLKAVRSL